MTPLLQVFLAFLKLGCFAFGGPVAHLGYFQEEFVRKRRWLSEEAYADLIALCQFLPGPASSQVGFAIGRIRGGLPGAFAAWIGFTLPSALIMVVFALGIADLAPGQERGWISGLKLAAAAVVANAIWNMAGKLCPDRERALIALLSAALLVLFRDAFWQVTVIIAGGTIGWLVLDRAPAEPPSRESHKPRAGAAGWPYLLIFGLLLIGSPLTAFLNAGEGLEVAARFYQAGSLVFGGGHVVLPLLESFTVAESWVGRDAFLAGYGAAQALPGPLFAFSAFLGTTLDHGPGGIAGGTLALIAIYLPSWLLVLGILPYWARLRRRTAVQAALRGTNAAVVGLLLAAFYNPVWTTAVQSPPDMAFALICFAALRFALIPPWAVVIASALAGSLLLNLS
ncbi:MAG: chromate efflux transporter [Oceanipulchritudo sp.]